MPRQFTDPWQDYQTDPQLRALVNMLCGYILHAGFTPSEVRKAAMMAAILAEDVNLRPVYVRAPDVLTGEEPCPPHTTS